MKTYVLDASALWIYLRAGASSPKVSQILKDAIGGRAEVLMSAVNYGEVYALILRELGSELALKVMNAVTPLSIEVVDVTPRRAFQAADIKAKFRLYYVDCFAAALAIEHKATLVTSDSDFRKLGHGFATLWLKA